MASLPHILRDMNAFFQDNSYAGLCNLAKLPNIGIKTADFTLAGFAGDTQRSLGKLNLLECEMTISAYDARILGFIGSNSSRDEVFTLRGAIDTGDSIQAVVVRQQGLWKGFEHNADLKPEEEAALKFMITVEVYELEIDGQEVIFIDKQNNVFRVNGVDRNAEVRNALGQ